MCWCHLKTILEVLQSIATIIGIAIGGAWVLYLFFKQRENKPRIEMRAEIVFHKKIGEWWIVELITYIENKGKVQHKLFNLDFDLAAIFTGDAIEESADFGKQAKFPHEIVRGSFKRNDMEYFFLEPGVKGKYSFVARVPSKAEAILLHSYFAYNINEMHGAEVTALVPKDSPENQKKRE